MKFKNIFAIHDNRELFKISPIGIATVETENGKYSFSVGMAYPGVNVIQMISENGCEIFLPKIVIHYNY